MVTFTSSKVAIEMIKKIRVKIFSSFMLLVLMLLIAGLMSIWELRKMNNSFSDVIDNNYQSIEHALKVIYALEREDSGILMLYLGDVDEGTNVIHRADSIITQSMVEIKKNATEPGEQNIIQSIEDEYKTYYSMLDSVALNKISSKEMVYNNLHKQFIKTKSKVNSLMEVNQSSMYTKASSMHKRLYQTMMPAIISIILAIVFALILNFFITRYFVTPIHKLIQAIQGYRPPDVNLKSDIKSEDELKTLQIEINNLITRILSYKNQSK